jgi:alkylated DNA repair dioxygenase AlkB
MSLHTTACGTPSAPPLPPRARKLAKKRLAREELRRAAPPPLYSHHTALFKHLSCDLLQTELGGQLRQESIVGASGESIPERRLTAWQSDSGASFRYSGKVMTGPPLSPQLAEVRDALHARFGVHFDSVLINLYPSGESCMGWHSDPQGDEWAQETAVVSVGSTRKFGFRSASSPTDVTQRRDFTLHSGDVIWMGGQCQKLLQHALFATEAREGEEEVEPAPRISLVYKRRVVAEEGAVDDE